MTDALLTEAEAASAANKNYGEAQLVSVANDTGSQFFDEARLKREKAHDEALDTIQKTLKDSSLSDAEKEALTAAQVAQIRDIVMSKSNVTAQNITVVEVK